MTEKNQPARLEDEFEDEPRTLMEAMEEAALAALIGTSMANANTDHTPNAADEAWIIAERFCLDARQKFRERFVSIYHIDPSKVLWLDNELKWVPAPADAEEIIVPQTEEKA